MILGTDPAHQQDTGQRDVVLRLKGISKSFGEGVAQTNALKSVNLTVLAGEFVAIVGPSGSGKSTLLNIVGLLESPSSGEYELAGRNAAEFTEPERDEARSRDLGFVFQASHMMPQSTVSENAALGLSIQGASMALRERRATEALSRLNMMGRRNELAQNLSGGEKQRTAISRAIATGPRLLLADEPTGSLDTKNSEVIIDYLQELNRSGVTVVVITHDPLVAAAAERQVSLTDGCLDDGVSLSPVLPDPARVAETSLETEGEGIGEGQRRFTLASIRSSVLWRRMRDELSEAVSIHASKPARTLFLLFAFLLGSGGLVSGMGLSESAASQVAERLTEASLDEVEVFQDRAIPVTDSRFDRWSDHSSVSKILEIEGVKAAGVRATVAQDTTPVSRLQPGSLSKTNEFSGPVLVSDSGFPGVVSASVFPHDGAELLSNTWNGHVALVGVEAAKELGLHVPSKRVPVETSGSSGSEGLGTLWVAGQLTQVVGFIDGSGREANLTRGIVVSASLSPKLEMNEVSIVVRSRPGYPAPLSEAIPLTLAPANPSEVQIATVADLRNLTVGVSTDLGVLVSVMSIVLLVLAALSSATAMYLSVQARSSEIALRRAIGASRSSIWRMFTFEGLMIGTAGGVAGSAVGVTAVIVLCLMQGWSPVLDIRVVVVGLLAGAVSGVLSSMYPALVAATAAPAQALRS